MNRKILALLIVLIAAISIANVCAVELTKENLQSMIYDESLYFHDENEDDD